jgi:hypothetical protein
MKWMRLIMMAKYKALGMRRNTVVLIGLGTVLLWSGFASGATRPIAVTLTAVGIETHLRLARPYVTFPDLPQDATGYTGSTLSLEATLPDFIPLHDDSSRNPGPQSDDETILASGRWLLVDLSQGTKSGMLETIAHLKKWWTPLPADTDFPGFEVFSPQLPGKYKEGFVKIRYLIPKDIKWRNRVWIQCPVNPQLPASRLYCQVHTDFYHLMYGDYTVSRSSLSDWESLNFKVKHFISTFILDAATQR